MQLLKYLLFRMIDESSEYPKNKQKLILISLFVDKIKNLIDEQREARFANNKLEIEKLLFLIYQDCERNVK